MLSTRRQVLSCYKKLMKTRKVVFKDDDFALKESHAAVRLAFEKNRHIQDEAEIMKSIEIAQFAEEYLRKDVMQARIIDDNTVRLNVREDNVKEDKSFKFVDDVRE